MKWLIVTMLVIVVSCFVFGTDGVSNCVIAIGKLVSKLKFKGLI